MKILALDIGDRWIGVAISDALGMFARPLTTVEAHQLNDFLAKTLEQEPVKTVVVGYPKTLRGTESEQTKKIVATADQLKQQFTAVAWVLWDERMTSKQAGQLKKTKTKEEKLKSHALAAAFILQSYLDYLHMQKIDTQKLAD